MINSTSRLWFNPNVDVMITKCKQGCMTRWSCNAVQAKLGRAASAAELAANAGLDQPERVVSIQEAASEARERLFFANMRLVLKVANALRNRRNANVEDLVDEGFEGLRLVRAIR